MHNDPLIKLEDTEIPVINILPSHKTIKKQIHPSLTTSASGHPHRIGSWPTNAP